MTSAEFDGRVALVTGAASGLGRQIAILFGQRGAAVAVADIDRTGAEAVVAELSAGGARAEAFTFDVSVPDAAARLVTDVVAAFGGLDAAVNNAAIEGPFAVAHTTSIDDWRRTIDVNLSGAYYCMRAELQHMVAVGRGVIVNVSSINGQVGTALSVAYTAAKHGVIGMTKAAALEYAKRGIRINALCPGWMDTPMVRDRASATMGTDLLAHAANAVPIGRAAHPSEVAEGALWLCSPAASYMTGQCLTIDGGYTAG